MTGLFGEDFEIDLSKPKKEAKKLIKKLASGKTAEGDAEKLLSSKSLSMQERLAIINEKVIKTLGKQRLNTVVIRSLDDFSAYIDKAIAAGRIDVDTETNNTTDPMNCEMVGLCLYVPGERQAYIPIKHVNYETGELLPNQLTYEDCAKQLKRLLDLRQALRGGWLPDYPGQSYTEWYAIHVGGPVYPLADFKFIMHNGKFDYEVIKKTCGIDVEPDWDTIIGARLIDENTYSDKRTSLKYMYCTLIDPSQAKYDIEGLFEHVPYAFVDPEIFALYAATDSMMTDKLYLWELKFFEGDENAKLKWLFDNIEMPIVSVTARMEMRGVTIDQDFGARLKAKYNGQLADIDAEINAELERLKDTIVAWRLTPEANEKTRMYVPKKSKMSKEKIEETYNLVDAEGNRYKETKPKSEQLADPINLASPPQLAILFYDILKAPVVNKSKPRGTGEEELNEIAEKMPDLTICGLLLKRRAVMKLITTYIDVIPDLANHWADGRVRFKLNSMGTDTGRYSSGGKWKFLNEDNNAVEISGINIQNIPSHNPEIRMLFKAKVVNDVVEFRAGEQVKLPEITEIDTQNGFRFVKDLFDDSSLSIVATDGSAVQLTKLEYSSAEKTYVILPAESCKVYTRTRYKIVGSDYSAQEPRLTAFVSQDQRMIQAYVDGKDLYAVIAQSAFNNNYEDNLEFYPEGTVIEEDGRQIVCGYKTNLNKAGKERRKIGKTLQLAATYGMSGATAGSRMGKTKKEGEALLNSFFTQFQGVKKTIDESKEFLKEHGYVEDWAGRRRHLPEINLDKYPVHLKRNDDESDFNPIIGCKNRDDQKDPLVIKWKNKVQEAINKSQDFQRKNAERDGCRWENNGEMSNMAYDKLAKEALAEGVIIEANTGKIAQAERQCFNARIQGGAASLTKLAMINIDRDPELRRLDAELIITVHDEVLVECPALYADEVEKRLPQIMIDTAKPYVNVPMKCDPYNVSRWYCDEAAAAIKEEYKKLEKKGMSKDDAAKAICGNHVELDEAVIMSVLNGESDTLEF